MYVFVFFIIFFQLLSPRVAKHLVKCAEFSYVPGTLDVFYAAANLYPSETTRYIHYLPRSHLFSFPPSSFQLSSPSSIRLIQSCIGEGRIGRLVLQLVIGSLLRLIPSYLYSVRTRKTESRSLLALYTSYPAAAFLNFFPLVRPFPGNLLLHTRLRY